MIAAHIAAPMDTPITTARVGVLVVPPPWSAAIRKRHVERRVVIFDSIGHGVTSHSGPHDAAPPVTSALGDEAFRSAGAQTSLRWEYDDMVAYADAAGARPLYPQGSPTSRLFFLVLGSGVRVLAGRAGVAETGRRPCQNYPIVRLGCMTLGRALGGDPLRGQ